ncbi:MAG: SRPBCC domain-containing protein [Pseudomonadota bacterium]
MSELILERHLPAAPDRVFAIVTQADHLTRWWGPEGMFIPEGDLALDAIGPWWSVMENKDGGRFKVSGQVTRVDPPRGVSFTWAWHDENDTRGEESTVTFDLEPADGGTMFRLTQVFESESAVANHEIGWTSSFRKLEAQF